MATVQIFVSFDIEHDGDLYEQLLAEAGSPTSGFAVAGGSPRSLAADLASDGLRRQIRQADQVIVICGEHTEESPRVSAELRIAQEERIPYFLLWGRRELMCKKPIGAKPSEGMYSWTRQILKDQITLTLRRAAADETAATVRGAARKR